MDLWVVAAAAGAGYIAKNLQNLCDDERESTRGPSIKYSYNVQSESRNFLQQLRDKTCPLRRLAQKRIQDLHSDDNISEIDRLSSKDGEERLKLDDGEDRKLKLVRNGRRCVDQMKPLNCCVEKVEHGTCLCPTVSTVLVSDGVWGYGSSFAEFDGENTVLPSSSSLKQFESVEVKQRCSSLQLSGSGDARMAPSQGPETMLLFITGMTVGILSATTSWKNEVDKLNKQLEQMENLVEDLHEEVDMKETLMVKELNDERDLPPPQSPIPSPDDIKVEILNDINSYKKNEDNAENLELLSRIEAELQAELEMLEQNIKASALERISSVVQLDPDFAPEIVQGDLKATMVNDASDSENQTTDTTTNCAKPANYAVSPWELSLRLHELIETRLETRIKELEVALGYRQGSGDRFSYSETESSSTHQSPMFICDERDTRHEHPPAESFSEGRNEILLGVMEEDRESMSNGDSGSEDEGSDESDMILIKRIIERKKSGSSLNLVID